MYKLVLSPCTSKLVIFILIVGALVLAQSLRSYFDRWKNCIFGWNRENWQCYFWHISMKTESPIKLWGSKLLFSDRLSRWTWKKYAEDQSFWLNFAVQNLPFLAIFGRFCHILDIFGPFLGHTMYVEWTSGCNQLWGSNCSIS